MIRSARAFTLSAAALCCAALTGCAEDSYDPMAQGSYFPPLGLSAEARALERRQSAHPQTPRKKRLPNEEIPLDEVIFEDEAHLSPPHATHSFHRRA